MRRTWRKAKPKPEKKFRVNEQIVSPKVFLIDENNEKIGIVNIEEALRRAQEAELDLVEVNPKINPPVVKILDYGQFKYKQEKKASKQKKQQKKVDVKVIRLSIRISKHDFTFRLNQAKNFLEKGHKLKIELIIRGRERQHPEKAIEVINNFVNELKNVDAFNLVTEQDLTRQGGRFTMVLINKK